MKADLVVLLYFGMMLGGFLLYLGAAAFLLEEVLPRLKKKKALPDWNSDKAA